MLAHGKPGETYNVGVPDEAVNVDVVRRIIALTGASEDLIEYGLIPEFIGRLPVMAAIHQLTRDDLITILTEPRNALTRQFQRFFEFDDIELSFQEDSLGAIADKALERETGARGLRSILEETLLDVQFELPSRRDVKKCVVTRETITKGLKPTLVTEAAPAGVRAGLVAVSGMTRNAGKLAAPLAMGALILVVPVSAALALVGAATLASVPLLRPVRRLDPLLAEHHKVPDPV